MILYWELKYYFNQSIFRFEKEYLFVSQSPIPISLKKKILISELRNVFLKTETISTDDGDLELSKIYLELLNGKEILLLDRVPVNLAVSIEWNLKRLIS